MSFQKCPICNGIGLDPNTYIRCNVCDGTKIISELNGRPPVKKEDNKELEETYQSIFDKFADALKEERELK